MPAYLSLRGGFYLYKLFSLRLGDAESALLDKKAAAQRALETASRGRLHTGFFLMYVASPSG